jgi:hypothetical protein
MPGRTPTFRTVTVRVPESGVVRIPHGYAHQFASIPARWREVAGVTSKYLAFPALDPASERPLPWWNR